MDSSDTAPHLVTVVDLDGPLPALPAATPTGRRYRKALAVVVLHGAPVAITELEVTPGLSTPPELVALLLWPRVKAQVDEHLVDDGLETVARLDPWSGTRHGRNGGRPRCLRPESGAPEPAEVSVVVPSFGTPGLLVEVVRGVLRGTQRPGEVVVARNELSDRSVAAVIRAELGDAVAVVDVPAGAASRVRNQAANCAHGSVLAFLGDDLVPDEQWLGGLLRGLARGPEVAAVLGMVVPGTLETPEQVRLHRWCDWTAAVEPHVFSRDSVRGGYRLATRLALPDCGNLAIRRDDFEVLGGFDVGLGRGTPARCGDELDLLMRLVGQGRSVAYEPRAWAWAHTPEGGRSPRAVVFDRGRGLGNVLMKHGTDMGLARELLRAVPAGSHGAPGGPTARASRDVSLWSAHLAGLATAPLTRGRSRPPRRTDMAG